METAGRIAFDKLYGTGEKKGPAMPWNIGGPQPAIRTLCDKNGFQGHVLDLGCGLGDNALYLASSGLKVTAVDISEVAIEFAREKAERLGLDIDFRVADVFTLADSPIKYDTILDSAFFHTLPEKDISQYLTLLRGISKPGTRLHLFTFAKELTPDFPGPRRVSANELRSEFSAEWSIDSIASARYSSSLPVEAVAQMMDPRTFEVNAPTRNLSGVGVDDTGCVVSTIWHMQADYQAA